MAHVLIAASKRSSLVQVYGVLRDLCESLQLSPDKIYLSGQLDRDAAVDEAQFDKYQLFQTKMKEDEL